MTAKVSQRFDCDKKELARKLIVPVHCPYALYVLGPDGDLFCFGLRNLLLLSKEFFIGQQLVQLRMSEGDVLKTNRRDHMILGKKRLSQRKA